MAPRTTSTDIEFNWETGKLAQKWISYLTVGAFYPILGMYFDFRGSYDTAVNLAPWLSYVVLVFVGRIINSAY